MKRNLLRWEKLLTFQQFTELQFLKTIFALFFSWAAENYPAPCLLGRMDLDENQLLHKNVFYAFPEGQQKLSFTIKLD